MQKLGSRFLQARCLKNTCGRVNSVEVCTKTAREVFGSLHVQNVLCPGGSKNGWYQKNFVLLKTQTASYLTVSWWRSYHVESSPLIRKVNQWTGFYMIGTSVMKELDSIFLRLVCFPARDYICKSTQKCHHELRGIPVIVPPIVITKLCWIGWFEILFENRNVDYKIHHFGETILIIFHHSKQNCHF